MSTTSPGRREIAHRIFAGEFDDATVTETSSDDERAPNYVISPSGARINRLFLVGVLTETEWVNEETLRARVVDPTGPFVLYASQYQPDARSMLDSTETPAFIAVTGKANTFRPDGSDRVFTSVRPEAVAQVDAGTRDRWAVSTARLTIGRLGELAAVLAGESATHDGIERAIKAYDLSPAYVATLYEQCFDVLRLVAGEIDAIPAIDIALDADAEPTTSLSDIRQVASLIAETTADEHLIEHDESAPSGVQEDTVEQESVDDPPVIDPTEPVLTSEEREDIESSFGTEFTTGDEIEASATPENDEEIAESADSPESTGSDDEAENDAVNEQQLASSIDDTEERDDASVDRLLELMEALGGGGGVERESLVRNACDEFEISDSEVTDLLQEALLSGRCYEAGEDVIRPI